MSDDIQKGKKNRQVSTMAIDYQHYERRARCLRSRMVLKWLGSPANRENCSFKDEQCQD